MYKYDKQKALDLQKKRDMRIISVETFDSPESCYPTHKFVVTLLDRGKTRELWLKRHWDRPPQFAEGYGGIRYTATERDSIGIAYLTLPSCIAEALHELTEEYVSATRRLTGEPCEESHTSVTY
jgi:hypothetical protein